MKPSISVIIPAYNAERTIITTIESVLSQTYSDFELIVINDGSTDNTLNLINEIKDRRLKVHSFQNAGLPTARNRGIKLATGGFISFIDADDLWTPDKLEKQLEALQSRPDAGVAYSWTVLIDESGKFLSATDRIHFDRNVYNHLLVKNFITSGSNVLIRTEAIKTVGLFDPALNSAADWDYWIRLARKCDFALVPRYQILYRVWSKSMSHDIESIVSKNLKAIDRAFLAAPVEMQQLKSKSLSIANQYFTFLYLNHKPNSNWLNNAFEKLKESIRLYPWIIFEKITQSQILTILLYYLLPYGVSTKVIGFIRRIKLSFMLLKDPGMNSIAAHLVSKKT